MAVYIETRGRFRAVAEEYLSPSLLNDYLRIATVSIAMGMVIGLSTVVIHKFYYYSHLLFEALIHTSILFTVILPVGGIAVAMASIITAANKTFLTSVSFVAETTGPSSIIFTLVAAATSYFISRESASTSTCSPWTSSASRRRPSTSSTTCSGRGRTGSGSGRSR